MKRIENFKDFTSERYKDIPAEFKFNKLVVPDRCPFLNSSKATLTELADRFYKHYEIVGDTYVDFFEHLQLKLDMRADTLERILTAYAREEDVLRIGNKTITDYNVTNVNELLNSSSMNELIDVPADNVAHDKPTVRDKSSATSKNQSDQTGDITVTSENVTGQPMFDQLNKFIAKHRGVHEIFIETFKDCFTVREVLTW